MRLLLSHRSRYAYPTPAALGPHTIRLRPATHAKAKIETYGLHVEPACTVRWQQDPAGNHIARLSFAPGERVLSLQLTVEMAVDVRPVNPFDFAVDPSCESVPFAYPPEIAGDLTPYFDLGDSAFTGGPLFTQFESALPRSGATVELVILLNKAVHDRLQYVTRDEAGVWTPETTLANGRASCRDSATLLVALLRTRGLAARFASGYLVQLTDEGMIPDAPRGVSRDVVDLHAWAEVYIPGGGWIGLDATSGLLCGEGHIPLACTSRPAAASPIEGTSDVFANDVGFEMLVGRLGHEARPTAPFTEDTWNELGLAGDRVDAALDAAGLALTVGGEPTFTSRLYPEKPEWNGDALGDTKWEQGLLLARELRVRLAPGGLLLHGTGKHYPGETLPRWSLDIFMRRDGAPLVPDRSAMPTRTATLADAEHLIDAIAARLGVRIDEVQPAFEDPWHFVREEGALPVAADPLATELGDPEERRRLARVLDRGLATPVGYVLPLTPSGWAAWRSERWKFRRERVVLVPGDSPIGLRLPLTSIQGDPPPPPEEEDFDGPPDPRRTDLTEMDEDGNPKPASAEKIVSKGIRTALCVEPRGGVMYVFLPPLARAARFVELARVIDDCAAGLGLVAAFEGYPPPKSEELVRIAVTPDPGVLEVNVPPTRTSREHAKLMATVFDAAFSVGLHAEKYQLDGREAGSGGGNHITLGGATPIASPFLRRPDLLASLITFVQHHPSISYLFTGLFVGPTSQAPRVDEGRMDTLYELEIALGRAREIAREAKAGGASTPWLSDSLFRNLLVDVTGNTHRAEICIDKLFDPRTPQGRQGIVELRAFEMPPHERMAVAQMALVRALVASFAKASYEGALVRWGQTLHDRFLLPTWLWNDFEDVLAHLERAGVPLPREAYRVFVEHRCPVVGVVQAGDVRLELRNAIEPWNVLGEELTPGGTTRFVDSSMERMELRVSGFVPERYKVGINGHELPLRATGVASEVVGGVRFRAWAPAHSLHPHLGVHHPLRFDLIDTWAKRSVSAFAYHVWHPEGRAYGVLPLTRFEAAARRAQRFTVESPMAYPAELLPAPAHPDAPYSLDLRRFKMDHPIKATDEEENTESESADARAPATHHPSARVEEAS